MNEKQNIQLKGQLRLYMQWPAIMTIVLFAMTVWIYTVDHRAGTIMFIFVFIYMIVVGMLYYFNKSMVMRELIEFATQYGIVQNVLLTELAIPYVIVTEDGKLVWGNEAFYNIVESETKRSGYIYSYIPELNSGNFPKEENQKTELELVYQEREYRAELRRVSVEGFNDTVELLRLPKEKEYFIAVYLQDVTELNAYIRENEEQRLVAGLIFIDNYDEVINTVEEVRQSLLVALIERKINQYVAKVDGIVKKIEQDKYFIVMRKNSFKTLEADKFSILEEVKNVNVGNGIPATLSIGWGLSKDAYGQSYNYARAAIDLALARGGDQAVIKDCHGIKYYGGKREQTSRNTRVKARVKAEALREFMMVKDQIFVMGHKMTDVDSFGASIGIYRAGAAMQKKVHIVINSDMSVSVRPLYEEFRKSPNYPDDMFVTSSEAKEMVNHNSLLVVVDTNRPKMTECEELLAKAKTIVVLDHHRKSSDNIENALLSYIEPYASSACEMVSEILQYIVEDIRIPAAEANCLYAGIMIDTNNFMNRSGVRTFEAAAFLRRCGADIAHVRKLLRDDAASYRAKAKIISEAQVYQKQFAIAKGENLNVESPTIVGAQAANELLDIDGIKASFVLTVYNGKVYISARSIDEINVQIIMEKLGGGGHMNASGAQLEHTDLERGLKEVKAVLDEMIAKGDISL